MKLKITCIVIIFFYSLLLPTEKAPEKYFVVVIPTYNNKYRCEANLISVLAQQYNNYHVIIIDDASTDGTPEILEKFITHYQVHHKVLLIKNSIRQGVMANLYMAIHMCQPQEIIVDLDGDDWLACDGVLAYLNTIYQNTSIWLTYGQFLQYPFGKIGWCQQLPQRVIDNNLYREYDWVASALRTFYAWLFHRIKKEDLQYNGQFFPMTSDLAFMFPMLEMSGKHTKFISDILYIYDRRTGFNDEKINRQLQEQIEMYIRSLKKYQPLQHSDIRYV